MLRNSLRALHMIATTAFTHDDGAVVVREVLGPKRFSSTRAARADTHLPNRSPSLGLNGLFTATTSNTTTYVHVATVGLVGTAILRSSAVENSYASAIDLRAISAHGEPTACERAGLGCMSNLSRTVVGLSTRYNRFTRCSRPRLYSPGCAYVDRQTLHQQLDELR